MDLNEIAIFVRVVEQGSFTAAAESLGLAKANVSRKVAGLERRLGTTLLRRTTRKLSLTDTGTTYFGYAQRVVAEMAAGEDALTQMQSAPQGLLRIAVSVEFGVAFLGGVVADYLSSYPEVQAEMVMSNDLPETLDEGIELAVRVGPLADSTLRARHLGTLRRVVCASPDYLAQHGTPGSPHDLANHDILLFPVDTRSRRSWVLNGPNGPVEATVSGRMVANNLVVLHEAALAGVGIGLLPLFRCADDLRAGRLQPLLCEWTPPLLDVHVVYPPDRNPLPRVSAFIELLRTRMSPPPWEAAERQLPPRPDSNAQ